MTDLSSKFSDGTGSGILTVTAEGLHVDGVLMYSESVVGKVALDLIEHHLLNHLSNAI